jgi:hypothetical protein
MKVKSLLFVCFFTVFVSDQVFSTGAANTDVVSNEQISITGTASKVSDNGVITPFVGGLSLVVGDESFDANFLENKEGFKISGKIPSGMKIGDKVTIKVANPDLFILSPFAGDFHLPNINSGDGFEVRLINRNSRLYTTLSEFDRSYSVQVVTTNNEGGAIDVMNELNASATLSSCYAAQKCSAYYESYMRSGMPNNGYFYKVKIGAFPNKEAAEAMRDSIKKKDNKFPESFVTANIRFFQ